MTGTQKAPGTLTGALISQYRHGFLYLFSFDLLFFFFSLLLPVVVGLYTEHDLNVMGLWYYINTQVICRKGIHCPDFLALFHRGLRLGKGSSGPK